MSPVFAFIAITWFRGVAMNMTPSFTSGGASCPPIAPVDSVQAGTRLFTLLVLIWLSGLNTCPLYVRRYRSQLAGSGVSNRCWVTNLYPTVISLCGGLPLDSHVVQG